LTDRRLIQVAFPLKQASLDSVHEKNVRHGHISTLHIWPAGDVIKVDAYLDARGLRCSQLFHQLLQALIELAPDGSEERALLESISNHLGVRGETRAQLL